MRLVVSALTVYKLYFNLQKKTFITSRIQAFYDPIQSLAFFLGRSPTKLVFTSTAYYISIMFSLYSFSLDRRMYTGDSS